MLPHSCRVALKEWAVAARALGKGEQTVLLRKGGIHEEGLDFRVVHRQFVLYPTFEHQKSELVKPKWQRELADTVAKAGGPGQVTFSLFGDVTSLVEVWDQQKVDALSSLHLWTDDYAQRRLHWQPRRPLTVLLVRAYRMQPVTLPVLPQYAGCTSWVELAQAIPLRGLAPVVSDERYQRKVAQVLEILDGAGSTVS